MQENPHFEASFKFDLEIERTFKKFKKQIALEESTSTPTMVGGEKAQRRTLQDCITPGAHTETSSITMTPMVANNFELKPDRPQVHGCCSVDQGRSTETKFGLPSVPFLNFLNKIVIQVGNFE